MKNKTIIIIGICIWLPIWIFQFLVEIHNRVLGITLLSLMFVGLALMVAGIVKEIEK